MRIVLAEEREGREKEKGELTHLNTGEGEREGLARGRGGSPNVATLEKRREDTDESEESTILLSDSETNCQYRSWEVHEVRRRH